MNQDLTPEAWTQRYEDGNTPWDLGTVSPPFVEAVKQRRFTPGRLAIPGCGRGHEAIYFARHGFTVTAFDIAVPACNALRNAAHQAGVALNVEVGDALAVPKRFEGAFDYVLEQTFFCAIDPNRRLEYVEAATKLLKPGGTLFGLFFDFKSDDGPPFGSDADELRALFSDQFHIRVLERCETSHPRRRGDELWAEFEKKV